MKEFTQLFQYSPLTEIMHFPFLYITSGASHSFCLAGHTNILSAVIPEKQNVGENPCQSHSFPITV